MNNNLANTVVVVFDEEILQSVSIDQIKTDIASTLSSLSPSQPVIAQLPDMIFVTIPEAQMHIIFEKKRITFSDNIIGDFFKKDNLLFLTFITKILKNFKQTIGSYGFNFIYEINGENFETLTSKLDCKSEKISSNLDNEKEKIKFILPTINFAYKNSQVILKFEANIVNNKNELDNQLKVFSNIHFNETSMPELDKFKESYEDSFKRIDTLISNIFK